jgi:hypothetical protein
MLVADYLNRTGVQWDLKVSRQSLVIEINEKTAIAQKVADELLDHCIDFLADSAANLRLEDARIRWSKKRGHEHRVPALWSDSNKHNQEDYMTSFKQTPDRFVWFGGIIVPELRSILARMEDSDEPTGLVQPIKNGESVIRTVQWGINKASVDLFGFNAMSMEDMRAAIQRDTSGDWYPEDLARKRQLYSQADSRFEQVARIRTKEGWMLVHFQCERTDIGELVLSRGKKESDVVERPELLMKV